MFWACVRTVEEQGHASTQRSRLAQARIWNGRAAGGDRLAGNQLIMDVDVMSRGYRQVGELCCGSYGT